MTGVSRLSDLQYLVESDREYLFIQSVIPNRKEKKEYLLHCSNNFHEHEDTTNKSVVSIEDEIEYL